MSELYQRFIVEKFTNKNSIDLKTIGLLTWHFLGNLIFKIVEKANENEKKIVKYCQCLGGSNSALPA